MRINRIIKKTYAEGPNCRFCIWVQGCRHKCDGCFATDLWDFNGGFEISVDEIIAKIKEVGNDIDGITFLGGEPFEYSFELSEIAKYIHSINKSVITFTGYTYENLCKISSAKPLLNHTDLLIDGKFEKENLDYSRALVGSSNQRFIFLSDKIPKKDIDEYKNRFEIRIDENGNAHFNGMGNIDTIKKFIKNNNL